MDRQEAYIKNAQDEALNNAKAIVSYCLEKKKLKKLAFEFALLCVELDQFVKQYKKFKDFFEEHGKKTSGKEFMIWMKRYLYYVDKNRIETLSQNPKENKLIDKIEEI